MEKINLEYSNWIKDIEKVIDKFRTLEPSYEREKDLKNITDILENLNLLSYPKLHIPYISGYENPTFKIQYSEFFYAEIDKIVAFLKDEISILKCSNGFNMRSIVLSDEVKKDVEIIMSQIKNDDIFESFWIGYPRSMIFQGPPGTWKTLLAKIMSNSSRCNFLNVPLSDILGHLVWSTEKSIDHKYRKASEMYKNTGKFTILFIDEADWVVEDRRLWKQHSITGEFLQHIDGTRSRKWIITIFATNYLDKIDSAIKSRAEYILHFKNPSHQEIERIFEINLKQRDKEIIEFIYQKIEDNHSEFEKICKICEDNEMSGRDINNIINIFLKNIIMDVLTIYNEKNKPRDFNIKDTVKDLNIVYYLEEVVKKRIDDKKNES